uniref:FBD domain-containing protein n=1 Tax=Brassica oleracea var. oleracea TaxID=109376 RepID=A0A0D3ALQ4_BRAOL
MDSYPIGDFSQLISLKVCTCSLEWYRLILRRAPKLRVLRFQGQANDLKKCYGDFQSEWEGPSSVPECLISSIETIEWIYNKGTEAENSEVCI